MRCSRCWLVVQRCLCAVIPTVTPRTRVVVLRHVLERHSPSNTARLAALAMPSSCEIIDYGGTGPLALDALAAPGTWLLYPEAGEAPAGVPAALVVLDGTWPQARRMAQRVPALRGLPRLSLPPPPHPVARARTPPRPDGMATLEAIARALELLEGPEVARPLDALFGEAVRRLALTWP